MRDKLVVWHESRIAHQIALSDLALHPGYDPETTVVTTRRGTHGESSSDFGLRAVRSHAGSARRQHSPRRHRAYLCEPAAGRNLLAHAAVQGIRRLRNVAVELHQPGERWKFAVHCHSGISLARLPARLLFHQHHKG